MIDFISGKAIIEDQDIKAFEFFEHYIKKGLQPYDKDVGKPIPPPDVMQKRLRLKEAKNVLRNLEERLVELRLPPERIKKGRMTLPQALKAFGQPLKEETEGKIKRIKGEINTLMKELSTIKNDSWVNYDLPVSATEAKKVLDDIVSYLYKVKETQKYIDKKPTERDEIKGDEIAFPKYAFTKIGKFHPGKTHYDLIFKNQPIRLKGLGADYIYYLMRNYKHPNKIDVVKLWGKLSGIPEEDPNNEEFKKTIDKQAIERIRTSPDEEFVEMTDIKTIGQIRENIKDLQEEKEEAKKNNDYGRIDAIKTKLDELYKYLSESTIQGRIKTFSSQKNRIIDRVRKAMENTLSEIRKDNEEAYNHLSTAFKPLTSDPKSYKPTEDIPWKFN